MRLAAQRPDARSARLEPTRREPPRKVGHFAATSEARFENVFAQIPGSSNPRESMLREGEPKRVLVDDRGFGSLALELGAAPLRVSGSLNGFVAPEPAGGTLRAAVATALDAIASQATVRWGVVRGARAVRFEFSRGEWAGLDVLLFDAGPATVGLRVRGEGSEWSRRFTARLREAGIAVEET